MSASAQFIGRSRVSYCLEDGTQCLQGELMIGGWWLVIGDLQTLSPSDSTPNLGEQFMGYCTCPLVQIDNQSHRPYWQSCKMQGWRNQA